MSMIFALSAHSSTIIQNIQQGVMPMTDIELIHVPKTDDGQDNLWPYGLRDTRNNAHAWFEEDMLLVWGGSDASRIFKELRSRGVKSAFIG